MKTEDTYKQIVAACAAAGVRAQQRLTTYGTPMRLYLYYRESDEASPGTLSLLTERQKPDPDMYLATAEHLPVTVPYDSYFQWVYDRARSAPILPTG
jgi:hypothetical protein